MPTQGAANYWDVYREWKDFGFSLTLEQFESLDTEPKKYVQGLMINISKQGIPFTPRLAGMAIRDRN